MSSTLRGYIMTKARDIADGQSVDTTNFVTKSNGAIEALDGSALTSLTPANLDDTGTIPSQLLAGVGGGKVLQVNRTDLASGTNTQSNTMSSMLDSNTITLSSASNFLLVDADIEYELKGNGATANPEAYLELRTSSGTILDTRMLYYSDISNNYSNRIWSTSRLSGFYSPTSTTETVSIFFQCDQGRIDVTDSTSITITEIEA
jgi:hypothetical protein